MNVKTQKKPDYLMAVHYARNHLEDLLRVQSIIWQMADGLKATFAEAESSTDEIILAESEAFMKNVLWLMDALTDASAKFMKKELIKAGIELIPS